MSLARQTVGYLMFLALAACATAPTPQGNLTNFNQSMRVCPGHVSNAPGMDSRRQIADYSAFTQVSGVTLARAPTNGCVSSGYGPRRGGAGSFHHGLDIFTNAPTPIYASGDGVVEEVKSARGYGRMVLIRHSTRVKTRYAHLSSYEQGLRPGDRVRKGMLIGYTGDTGNATAVHLHYEILVNDRARDPLTVGR